MAGSFMLNGIEYFGNDGKNILCQEVTQAQYNALPASKLTDGIMYFITDASDGAAGFPPLIYSDQEREIGVWIDGKPLYEKTISNASLPQVSNWALLDDTISYDKLIYIEMTGASEQYPVMPTSSTVPRFRLDAYSLSDHKLYYYSESNAVETITLRYTKATDTAGSGTWTTQGVLAHHYSTTEHVIGTWIDGKPLYEKTYRATIDDCYNMVSDAVVFSGDFALDKINYDCLWLEQAFLFYKNASSQTNTVYTNVLNYPNTEASPKPTMIRCNIQKSTGNNDGYPHIYVQKTYTPSMYNYMNDVVFYFIVKYTKTTD